MDANCHDWISSEYKSAEFLHFESNCMILEVGFPCVVEFFTSNCSVFLSDTRSDLELETTTEADSKLQILINKSHNWTQLLTHDQLSNPHNFLLAFSNISPVPYSGSTTPNKALCRHYLHPTYSSLNTHNKTTQHPFKNK